MSHLLTDKNLGESAPRPVFTLLIALLLSAFMTVGVAGSPPKDSEVFSKCWEFNIESNLDVIPVTDANAVYFFDDKNKLHAVDLTLGNNLWSSEIGGEVASNLFVLGDLIFIATRAQSDTLDSPAKTTIRALSRQTGITVWQAETSTSPFVWLGAVMQNVIVTVSQDSASALNSADGKLIWKRDLPSAPSSQPYFHETGIELATLNREIVKIGATSGTVEVAWKSENLPTAVLTDASGRLVVGDERGNLVLISPEGDRLWRFRNGAQISSASLHDSEYLAASYDNFIYKLSRSGNVKWKRRLSGRVSDKPLVLGDTAVVSIAGTGSVYALDLKNGKISNRIETGDDVSLRVAAAPAGEVGFAILGPRGISFYREKCSAK
jgi:outer membrane protein assembly factor BamB